MSIQKTSVKRFKQRDLGKVREIWIKGKTKGKTLIHVKEAQKPGAEEGGNFNVR